MEVELTDHLGYEPHAPEPPAVRNTATDQSQDAITEHGQVDIDAPRIAGGQFGPTVRKRQRRLEGDVAARGPVPLVAKPERLERVLYDETASSGFDDFIQCLGYKAEIIKRYFLEYNEALSSDFVLSN